MKPERVKRDSFSRRIKDWTLALAAVTTMTVAAQCSAATLYFPGPSTNATPLIFKAIACGGWHSLGVQTNGTVVAWGDNSMDQTNVPSGLSGVIAVAGGEAHSLALRSDSTVVAWGDNSHGESTVPSGLSNVVAIAAGGWHSLALRSGGGVVAWGDNSSGESYVPGDLFNAVAIAAGSSNNLAVKSEGTVEAWGGNTYGQSTVPSDLSNVVAVAAGQRHCLALKSDGTVVAWGDNSMGQTNVPAGLSGVIAISAGAFHNLALKSDGTVVVWGANDAGQSTVPAGLGNVVAVAAGERHSVALKSDGTITAWGDNSYGQSTVPVVYTADLNLQDTVDEAQNGDTILVAPGQYNLTEQVIITNAITLQSEQGAGVTVLNLELFLNRGLWVSNSAAVVDGFTVQPDYAYPWEPTGIFLVGGTVQNCVFPNFLIGWPGSAVYMVGGILSNSVVANYHRFNGSDSNSAVYCSDGGLVTDCQVSGGADGGSSGSGLYLVNSQLRNCLLSGSLDGPADGAALAAYGSTMVNCTITHNSSQSQGGGGAYLDSCLMDRCIVSNNACFVSGANQGGAGIFETNSLIRDSLIVGNYAGVTPGTTTGASGGGVYMRGGALVNCTISGNSVGGSDSDPYAPGQGSGVYAESGGITNCVIFGNGPTNWFNAGSDVFDHCCTTPDPGGVGNIVQDPQFVSPTNGDYHLTTNSPCLAAGIIQSWMTGALDLDGNPRTVNGTVDTGAYESQPMKASQPVTILNPRWIDSGFAFSFHMQTNHAYSVQCTYSLAPASWQIMTNISGVGTMMNFTNQNTVSPSCFYRVMAQ
ncbi:MAG TPA: hypothetical protein VNZ25_00835 [Candidatus Angelobacter sp.]|jgi:alpha-tubulin suppressor-like RCC1 family protein|nr:hypothetical protein [Candidatus Angelobacter sp.]